MRAALDEGGGPIDFRYFEWSGRNSSAARSRAATDLRRSLQDSISRSPGAVHFLISHSHGAHIVLHALAGSDRQVMDALGGIVLLSPPLLTCRLVKNPANVANRLLLGAIAGIPLVFLAWASMAIAMHWTRPAVALSSLVVIAAWLTLFRPTRVRRRAEALVAQLALPRIDFPGLVIRAPGDEASAALSSIAAFERVARFVRARILDARPFDTGPDRLLRDARTWRELAWALGEAWLMVPVSVTTAQWLFHAAEQRQWVSAAALVPVVIVFATGALATVGGAMLLVLLLPASFLLWPFGIAPTAAATLLSVSLESSPAPSWRVVDLPEASARAVRDWRHSTHGNREALDALSVYLGG